MRFKKSLIFVIVLVATFLMLGVAWADDDDDDDDYGCGWPPIITQYIIDFQQGLLAIELNDAPNGAKVYFKKRMLDTLYVLDNFIVAEIPEDFPRDI